MPGMRCLYEVLEVERDAADDTIKKAYRKLALTWHPDKNQHRLEEADERFKEIQNAYEILSDPHERAWYDSHREAILRQGGRHQAGAQGDGDFTPEKPPDEPDLFMYFSSSCYSGYGDGIKSFYVVYGSLFDKLSSLEAAAMEQQGRKPRATPTFGGPDSDWPTVRRFYDHWLSFASVKEFAWADIYNLASAPNRKYRRAMETDNLKRRKAERREFNENVRALVAFVKKRDKRVAAHQAAEAAKRAQRAEEEAARREAERLARAQRAAEYKEAAWILDAEQASQEEGSEEDEEEELETFHCVACDKYFKSERAMHNHERSKKHLENVAWLRQVLEEEEAALAGAQEADDTDEHMQDVAARMAATTLDEGSVHPATTNKPNINAAAAAADDDDDDSDSEDDGEDDDSDDGSEESSSGNTEQSPLSSEEKEERTEEEEEDLDEDELLARLAGHAAARQEKHAEGKKRGEDSDTTEEEEEEEAEEEAMLLRMAAQQRVSQDKSTTTAAASTTVVSDDDDDDWSRGGGKKKNKGGGKSRGGSARQGPGGQSAEAPPLGGPTSQHHKGTNKGGRNSSCGSTSGSTKNASGAPSGRGPAAHGDTVCGVCGKEFPSRTKLFAHIKAEGHAQLK